MAEEEDIAAAVKILTDSGDCPLCNYGGFWFVDPKTGRNRELDRRARRLAQRIYRKWNKKLYTDKDCDKIYQGGGLANLVRKR